MPTGICTPAITPSASRTEPAPPSQMTTQACDQIAKPVRSPIGPRHQHPHHNTPNGFLLFPHNGGLVEFGGFFSRNRPGFCRSHSEVHELRRRFVSEGGEPVTGSAGPAANGAQSHAGTSHFSQLEPTRQFARFAAPGNVPLCATTLRVLANVSL